MKSIPSVFTFREPGTLWTHLVECWSCGFGYDESVSYEFNFTRRLFDTAMQAMNDDYDAYMYEQHRDIWRLAK